MWGQTFLNPSRALLALGLAGACLGLAGPAGAGTWLLANGDRLTGELVAETGDYIEVQHAQLGRLKVPRVALEEPKTAKAEADQEPELEPGEAELEGLDPKDPSSGVKPNLPEWKRQVELGYVQQSGSREKQDLSVRLQLDGQEGANTFRATGRLLRSDAGTKVVTDRREADFRWRYDISKRLFTQALTTYGQDNVRQIDLSLEQQIGGGFRLMDTARHKANVGLGAVVQHLERADAGEQTTLLGSFFQDYSYRWNRRVRLTQEASLLVADAGSVVSFGSSTSPATAPADGNFRFKLQTGVQSKVTASMSVNVRYEYDYDRSIPDADLRTDQRLTTSLGYLW